MLARPTPPHFSGREDRYFGISTPFESQGSWTEITCRSSTVKQRLRSRDLTPRSFLVIWNRTALTRQSSGIQLINTRAFGCIERAEQPAQLRTFEKTRVRYSSNVYGN